jgi:hypothetical protein
MPEWREGGSGHATPFRLGLGPFDAGTFVPGPGAQLVSAHVEEVLDCLGATD